MKWAILVGGTFLLAASVAVKAETQVVIVGGGFEQDASQGQIEQNVLWLEYLLRPRVKQLDIFYGSGNTALKDVVFWDEQRRSNPKRNPLADVYGLPADDWQQYRHHSVTSNQGSTEASHLKTTLTSLLKQPVTDNLLFVYNGHGGYGGYNKPDKNSLKLWNNTQITVQQLRSALDLLPQRVTARFLVAQCYSGGFYHLVNESSLVTETTPHKRCGFMAEAPDRESEGCALGINKDEFRDYSTYFFSALTQKPRYDDRFVVNPDRDNSGKVSYREAHFYALVAALSNDLSRSTSEMYLEEWEPWFVRWFVGSGIASSEYHALAKEVAKLNNIDLNSSLYQQRQQKQLKLQHISRDLQAAEVVILKNQQQIQRIIELDYPFLKHPYSRDYIAQIESMADPISSKIAGLKSYAELVEKLTVVEALQKSVLNAQREITQLEKVSRLLKLARLQTAFNRYASDSDKRQYRRLLDCENATL